MILAKKDSHAHSLARPSGWMACTCKTPLATCFLRSEGGQGYINMNYFLKNFMLDTWRMSFYLFLWKKFQHSPTWFKQSENNEIGSSMQICNRKKKCTDTNVYSTWISAYPATAAGWLFCSVYKFTLHPLAWKKPAPK